MGSHTGVHLIALVDHLCTLRGWRPHNSFVMPSLGGSPPHQVVPPQLPTAQLGALAVADQDIEYDMHNVCGGL